MWRIGSVVTKDCQAQFVLQHTTSPLDESLKPDEVIMRVDAAPINPSDLGLICPPGTDEASLQTLKDLNEVSDKRDKSLGVAGVSYQLDKKFAPMLAARFDKFLACGNEGAGVVIKAGGSPEAQSLLNKVVAGRGGRMYGQYRKINLRDLIVHNAGTTAEEAASSYINPMTVLGMIETMKRENHSAIIHTAAASNLGQMLLKLCMKEKIPLINIVRKESQEKLLLSLGASENLVLNSSAKDFNQKLIAAITDTKATLCFDAIGGGKLSSQILTCMEIAATNFTKQAPSPYGTDVLKQVYIYGGLDRSPTIVSRGFGLSFSIAGWLMPRYLEKLDPEVVQEMYKTVADEIKGVFKSEYYKRVSLKEAVEVENFTEFAKQETGKKFLVMPNKDVEQFNFKL